jgi:non-canonical (house-cleaning) NTP pyrophosphatase
VGILTDNAIDRQKLYEPAVVMALIPFKNPDLYPIP